MNPSIIFTLVLVYVVGMIFACIPAEKFYSTDRINGEGWVVFAAIWPLLFIWWVVFRFYRVLWNVLKVIAKVDPV